MQYKKLKIMKYTNIRPAQEVAALQSAYTMSLPGQATPSATASVRARPPPPNPRWTSIPKQQAVFRATRCPVPRATPHTSCLALRRPPSRYGGDAHGGGGGGVTVMRSSKSMLSSCARSARAGL